MHTNEVKIDEGGEVLSPETCKNLTIVPEIGKQCVKSKSTLASDKTNREGKKEVVPSRDGNSKEWSQVQGKKGKKNETSSEKRTANERSNVAQKPAGTGKANGSEKRTANERSNVAQKPAGTGKVVTKKEYDYKTEGRKDPAPKKIVHTQNKGAALNKGMLDTVQNQKGEIDALKQIQRDQREDEHKVEMKFKIKSASQVEIERMRDEVKLLEETRIYRNAVKTHAFVPFECECCRIAYPLTSHSEAIAHQLFGNIITGGTGKDSEVIRKGAVLQVKYVAKQSEFYESHPVTWSYELNKMLSHQLKYFDCPFNVLRRSVEYLEVQNRRSWWNVCRRIGNTILDVFRIGPSNAARSCIYGCINGMGTDVSDGVLKEQEIEVVKAEPILDFCSNRLDVSVPYGKIEQIGCWVCEPKFYNVGLSICSDHVTIPRGKCSHNELTFYATRQCTVPIYQELLDYQFGTAKEKRKIQQDYAYFCMRAFKDLQDLLRLPGFDMLDSREALDWFLESKPLAYRERLERGWVNLEKSWQQVEADSVLGRAFGKVEAMCGKERDKVEMRCVTSMTDEYLVEVGPLYQYWSKKMLKWLYPDFTTMISRPVLIVTGLSPPKMGEIVTHFEKEGYFAAQGDHSRFDGHCEEEMLDAEYWFYEQQGCFPEWHLKLLKAQRCTRSKSSTFAVTHKGKVASGKINTSVGDSLINAAMWVSFAKEHKIKDSVVMVCGDDHVVFTRDYFPAWEYNDWCKRLGHKNSFEWMTELVNSYRPQLSTNYDKLSFCSSWFPVINQYGDRTMHLLSGKALAKSFIPVKPLPVGMTMDEHVANVAVGFGHYDFSPVFGAFMQILRKGRKIKAKHQDYQFVMKEPIEVDPDVMAVSFMNRYGFDPAPLHNAILRMQLPEGLGVNVVHPLLLRMAEVDGVLLPPQ